MALIEMPPLQVSRAADLLPQPIEDRWLIRPLWGRAAVGLLGGHPKACKTWLGLDMAISVSSGTPCLRHFPVEQPGPALIYLAEDELPMVRSRIDAICRSRGVAVDTLPLHVITEPVLRLDRERDQQRLQAAVDQYRPELLLLDPLIRLHRCNENDATEISGLLGYFRELQRRFECAVMIVHHTSKKQRSRPGLCLRGSSDLHAFGSSNAYLTGCEDERLLLRLEHRAARCPDPILLELATDGADDATHLRVLSASGPSPRQGQLEERILVALRENGPLPATRLRKQLGVNNQRLAETLHLLDERGLIVREQDGWRRLSE